MKVKPLGIFILVILLTLCGLPVLNCRWEAVAESAPEAKGGDDLRAKAQNPVSSMYSLPLKLTADFGAGNGSAYFFNINPVIPVTVGDWNLISRALIPALVSVDGKIQGTPPIPEGESSDDRKTGLGDINYSLFVSPADATTFIWGIGPPRRQPDSHRALSQLQPSARLVPDRRSDYHGQLECQEIQRPLDDSDRRRCG